MSFDLWFAFFLAFFVLGCAIGAFVDKHGDNDRK